MCVSTDSTVTGVEHGIIKRRDGVYADPMMLGPAFMAAVGEIFNSHNMFAGLDYSVFIKALYDCGPDLPRSTNGELLVRFAADIVPFNEARRALYKAVKISDGKAEYYFEPAYLPDPEHPNSNGIPTELDFDEFVADMWLKGIKFGIDEELVRASIASSKTERVIVAQRLPATPGRDAVIVEVSEDIHRSDAPRQLANGKLDLMSFQNRFPQIKEKTRLLQKVPRAAGLLGFEMSGIPIEPAIPKDVELGPMAGLGTLIENTAEGEFLVAQVGGFLNVDTKSGQLSVGDKIVSREGVSVRTTGNLTLTGDYEEFGEVQEKRVVEGESITMHADVFGNVVSRGGTVLLNANLVSGSATNARGDIRIKGVASGAVVQANQGEVTMTRAENCVISGTRVTIEQAANCEIMADEVIIKQAEGCAIAARSVSIESAGPRKQSEMSIFALLPDNAKVDEVIAQMRERIADFEGIAARRQAEMDELTNQPEVKKYVMLASKIRKKELVLTPDQVPQFQKMALAVGPALKAIGKISLDVKAAQTERQGGLELVEQLIQQKNESAGFSRVAVRTLSGDVVVRMMKFNPDGSSPYALAAKDIKARLRSSSNRGDVIFSGSRGPIDWHSEGALAEKASA
jgi:hypothetical protein